VQTQKKWPAWKTALIPSFIIIAVFFIFILTVAMVNANGSFAERLVFILCANWFSLLSILGLFVFIFLVLYFLARFSNATITYGIIFLAFIFFIASIKKIIIDKPIKDYLEGIFDFNLLALAVTLFSFGVALLQIYQTTSKIHNISANTSYGIPVQPKNENDRKEVNMDDSDELKRAITGYQAAISLWKLASDQIYHRFSAMLIANSIIGGIGGLIISSSNKVSDLVLALPFIGIALCIVWLLFIQRGLKVETWYRKKSKELENSSVPNGSDIAFPPEQDMGFACLSYITIGIFIALYIVVAILLLIKQLASI
jgi:hypothetical protein